MDAERLRSRYTLAMLGLMLMCAVVGLTAKTLARWMSPELAVAAAQRSGYVFFSNFEAGTVSSKHHDPWGRTWLWRQVDSKDAGNWYTGDKKTYALYSAGPNGVDERLGGDDVLVRGHPAAALLDWSGEVFAGLFLVALWLAFGPGVRRPRATSRLREAALAGLIASFPIGASVVFLLWVQTQSWVINLQESQPIVLSAPVAWYGSAAVAWLLVAALIRFWVAPPDAKC